MEEVLVTSISTGGSGGEDRLTENVTLNFGKVTFAYTPQDSKGTVAGDKDFAWNIAENAQLLDQTPRMACRPGRPGPMTEFRGAPNACATADS
jgi:hypothetical protein